MSESVTRWSQQDEGQYFERKSAYEQMSDGRRKPRSAKVIAKDVVETLAAMANADGGELVIGIEDNGAVTGVPHPEDQITLITGAPGSTKYVHPPLRVHFTPVRADNGSLLLHFEVDWSPAVHQLSDGNYTGR